MSDGRYYSSGHLSPVNQRGTKALNTYQIDVHEDGEWQEGARAETRLLSISLDTGGGTVITVDLLREDYVLLASYSLSIDDLMQILERRLELTEVK